MLHNVIVSVLRGDKARFQVFGETTNIGKLPHFLVLLLIVITLSHQVYIVPMLIASRIESTGMKNRIQLSQDTADLLIEAGKENWIHRREDKIIAKGKGGKFLLFLLHLMYFTQC
jgi:hypothetical protein